jgi:hypothetical protein
LDIEKTSDNFYVAAHDWQYWQKMTQYKGALPPTRSEFLKHKLFNKYQPLDLEGINKWFSEHPDAILITDKIDNPADFSSKFIDKSRLKMELFTWKSLEEAVKSGVGAPMITGELLIDPSNKEDSVERAKKLGIKYAALSRRMADTHPKIIEKLINANIKIYAFHVNFDDGIDEEYVACKEGNIFYGMYADNWKFNSDIKCRR